ncbi:MAG: CBS domain-containing protein [Magnetococcales bacterium]|nr:CBS domain-containing protein [Magnetococcales bacterium]
MGCKITAIIERNVVTIDQDRTVADAVGVMADRAVGSIVVTGKGRVVGYFTERDLLTRVVAKKRNPDAVMMRDVMTSELITVPHDASCHECLDRMKEREIRHLLVYQDTLFVGIVSLRVLADLAKQGRNRPCPVLNGRGGVMLLVVLLALGALVVLCPEVLVFVRHLLP